MNCELCQWQDPAQATVFVYVDLRRRPGLHKELNSCSHCVDDAVRTLESDPETVGFAQVERWAA